jgi:Sulfotransferase domain
MARIASVALRVVGAGLGRTGTNSLKLALEQLLGAPCYHMFEVAARPDDVPTWLAAARGERVDFEGLLEDFAAIVDWPGAAYWREIAATAPDALILLSTRESSAQWWDSVDATILQVVSRPLGDDDPDTARRRAMVREMMDARFTPRWREREHAIAAYERHNADVRASVPSDRLIDWRPGDGWEPICAALAIDVPDVAFPHVNKPDEFHGVRAHSSERARPAPQSAQ